jgi:hypothetical protein
MLRMARGLRGGSACEQREARGNQDLAHAPYIRRLAGSAK